jgi:TubC N-terminal docking domain
MSARELLTDLAEVGLNVTTDGDRLVIRPASKLTDSMRTALKMAKPELLAFLRNVKRARVPLALSAFSRSDANIDHVHDRRERLIRWGWSEQEADIQAERLATRDREQDERVSCTDCRHYQPGRCGNHRRAGLRVTSIGRDFASLLQRCGGFQG